MTPNQRIFADEYLKDRNAVRAYMAAYPRVKNYNVAHVNANRLLRNATISEYVQSRLDEISGSTIADAKEIMEFYTAVMRGEITETVRRRGKNGEGGMVESPARLNDRIAAARELAKLTGAEDSAAIDTDTYNEHVLSLAGLINDPAPARTIESVLNDAQ